ncbi:hypothetical protein M9991_09745 [Chryseobacterium gallinarum]|uniref:hypothetical protein n=1 Tax=Chryseobacterium gallinarum TaxID=1324352 RepID=UPI0012E0656F|nr:hypothetical protein [Chryseobacterium gallinarum]MCL8537139.1 hypothetical protein [Chryseobacterium gallinarum]
MMHQQISRQQSLEAIKKKHPRFYEVLSSLPDYLKDNPQILEQLSIDSGADKAKILSYMDVKNTEGQVILLKNFSKSHRYGESGYSSKYGRVSYISASLVKGLDMLPCKVR